MRLPTAALAAPLLLAPLLLTACSSAAPGAPASASGSASATSASASAGAATTTTAKVTTGAALCALVPVAAAQAAAKADPAFTTAKAVPDQVECLYKADHGSIVSVEYSPAGTGFIDDATAIDAKTKTTAVTVGGRSGKAIDQVVQVDVGDRAISVFTIGHELDRTQLTGLAAAFLAKLS